MAHKILLGPRAVCGAGSPLPALQGLSLDEKRLEQETFGWLLAGRLEKEPSQERFSTRSMWEAVAAIAKTGLVEVMG